MTTNALEILEFGRQTASQSSVCAETSISFELELFGVHLELCAVCRNEKITLKDLVYPAVQLCDIIVRLAIEHQWLCGQPVTCSAGCMACCKYMVTVSPAEAIAINDWMNTLPRQTRQALLRNMTMAGRKILNTCPTTIKTQTGDSHSSSRLAELSEWYSKINLTCPWIENGLCSQYSARPLVCREFMVTSAPARCNPNAEEGRTSVNLPVRMSEVLMTVGAKLTGINPQAMFLPLVPAWCENFSDLQNRQFDTYQAARILIESIIEHQQQKMVPAAACS